jgi:hypothetical protein
MNIWIDEVIPDWRGWQRIPESLDATSHAGPFYLFRTSYLSIRKD